MLYSDTLKKVRAAIEAATDSANAMRAAVRLLKEDVLHCLGQDLSAGRQRAGGWDHTSKPSPHTRIPLPDAICRPPRARRRQSSSTM
jgi:hypothetical protein